MYIHSIYILYTFYIHSICILYTVYIHSIYNLYIFYNRFTCFLYTFDIHLIHVFAHFPGSSGKVLGVENDFFPTSFGDVWGMFWHHRWCLRRARKNQKHTFWSREKVRTKMMQNHLLIIFH